MVAGASRFKEYSGCGRWCTDRFASLGNDANVMASLLNSFANTVHGCDDIYEEDVLKLYSCTVEFINRLSERLENEWNTDT